MCMVTRRREPYIAEKDLTVFKVLFKDGDGFATPVMSKNVALNTMLSPDDEPVIEPCGWDYMLGIGFIHAYVPSTYTISNGFSAVVKAIIPKGSEYFIGNHLKEICARRMFITDEFVTTFQYNREEYNRLIDIYKPIYNEKPLFNLYGYVLCDEKYLYHPSKVPSDAFVNGFVYDKSGGLLFVRILNGETFRFTYEVDGSVIKVYRLTKQ